MEPPDDTFERLGVTERRLLLLVSAVQFVNILDFMVVMPLGPDFAGQLGIAVSKLGLIGGSYTAAAAVSGVLASRFLDGFDRRPALACTMLGLVIGTACGGLAQGLYSLMAARVVAGAFGGPATSLSLSIIADAIPAERRGRALGIVGGAFAVASVLGVPAALELSQLGGWRLPFFAIASLGVIVSASALWAMPALRLHLTHAPRREAPLASFVREPSVVLALLSTFAVMMAAFSIIPNLSAFVQENLHYPRARLGLLYLAGGSVSFVSMRLVGPYIDRFGASVVSAAGTAVFVLVLSAAFVYELPIPVISIFVLFMSAMAMRNVSLSTLSTRVPRAHERARFLSLQSAVQHIASALGAVTSAQLLQERADHSLEGMAHVAAMSIGFALALPLLLRRIEQRLRAREATTQPSAATTAAAEQAVAVVDAERELL